MTFSQLARCLLRRKSFYLLLACCVSVVTVMASVFDLGSRWQQVVTTLVGGLVFGAHIGRVAASARTEGESAPEPGVRDGGC